MVPCYTQMHVFGRGRRIEVALGPAIKGWEGRRHDERGRGPQARSEALRRAGSHACGDRVQGSGEG